MKEIWTEEKLDTFQTMGIILRAKMERLANEGDMASAREIEAGYNLINKHFEHALNWAPEELEELIKRQEGTAND